MSVRNLFYLVLVILFCSFLLNYSSNDSQLLKRKMLEIDYTAKSYKVTTSISHSNSIVQTIYNDKITTEPKMGYYYFQAGKGKDRKYVQVPIAASIIEEIDDVENKK